MGPLLKNTIFRQLKILKQGESTDVTESVTRLKEENGEFLQGVNYHFWLVIWTLQLRFFYTQTSNGNSNIC